MRYQAVVVMPESWFKDYLVKVTPEENGAPDALPLLSVHPSFPQPIVVKRVSDYQGVVSVHVAIDTAADYMGAVVRLVHYRYEFSDRQARTYARDTQPNLPFVWNVNSPEVGQHTFGEAPPIKAVAFGDLVVTVNASTGKPDVDDTDTGADTAEAEAAAEADAISEADELVSVWDAETDDDDTEEEGDDEAWDGLEEQPTHRTPTQRAKPAQGQKRSAKYARQPKGKKVHA